MLTVTKVITVLKNQSRAVVQSRVLSYHGSAQTNNQNDIHVINLRSDTFTLPTHSMKQAMFEAKLGDDVYGEDPTVNKLQETCAALLGKESALLLPTGTMGNIVSTLSHCQGRFQEIILGDQSHMHLYEVGGIAAVAGVHTMTVANKPDGTLDVLDIKKKIRAPNDPHLPCTKVICLENTQNRCGGRVLSLDYLKQVRQLADAYGLCMHLDGARLMNAAVALQVPASHITQYFDSVSMCFSKGLSCPMGSILAGSKDLISRALWARKALGGGMRQSGVIAAPMLVALQEIVPQLHQDHARAWRIAEAVANLGSKWKVDMDCVETNIVILHTDGSTTADQVCQRLSHFTEAEVSTLGEKIIVQMLPFSDTTVRFVTYQGITDGDIDKTIKKLQYIWKEI